MKRSEAIKNLLSARTHADLASMYNPNMEVQINVAQDGGERIEGDYKGRIWHGWSDGINQWKPFRIPHNAKTEPEDNDYEINYDLAEHAEGIGMTGWDWKNRLSCWVAFDFDGITGHSDKHQKRLTEIQLQEIQQVVKNIPWVTVRLSTSGKGLHLYVYLNPISTNNHNEHAAVARSILGVMAALTNFDYQSKVDTNGGNMWCWHRKMTGTNGLSLIKPATELATVPPNWKEHISVVTNRTKRTIPSFIESNDLERIFNDLTGQKTKIPLDEDHQRLIKFLHDTNACSWWDSDNHMLVTHTIHLKEAHEKLGLKGLFKTIAKGTEYGQDHNCFCHVMRKGAWSVRRYTPGVAEESTWKQDGQGWTFCYLNRELDFQTTAQTYGGLEHKSGGFIFREVKVAIESLKQLGINLITPEWINNRKCKLKQHKDGRLLIEIPHDPNDQANEMTGWLAEKGNWTKIIHIPINNHTEPETNNCDDMVRHLITETGEDYGWMIKTDKEWRVEPLVHVRTLLSSLNLKAPEVNAVLGSCISKPWKIVCRPFQPEILGDRDWNRNAPQLAYVPSSEDNLTYPTWLKILNHCGQGLDNAIKDHLWCKSNGILNGADYLKCWISSLFKEPNQPLPYLFFYSSEQDNGKSIFHESIKLLITSGVERADNALINQQGFNGELENAILCIVEETDMRKNKQAYNRIKDWVTSPHLPIHKKQRTPYSILNISHWIHCANEYQACPILPGDSRITMISVPNLTNKIPKKQLIPMLQKEAPDFLGAIMSLELPQSNDRLNIPVITTEAKKFAERSNQSYLDIFLEEFCFQSNGNIIKFSDFYDRFIEWIDADQLANWSKIRVGREIPSIYPQAKSRSSNQKYICDINWSPPQEILPKVEIDNGWIREKAIK